MSSPISSRLTQALRLFTLFAGVVLAVGGLLVLHQSSGEPADFRAFHGQPAPLRFPLPILGSAFHGNADGIVLLGVLLLVAAPMLRVLAAGTGYLRSRDWLYAGVSAIVLGVLLFSFVFHK